MATTTMGRPTDTTPVRTTSSNRGLYWAIAIAAIILFAIFYSMRTTDVAPTVGASGTTATSPETTNNMQNTNPDGTVRDSRTYETNAGAAMDQVPAEMQQGTPTLPKGAIPPPPRDATPAQ